MKLMEVADRRFNYDAVGSTTRTDRTPAGYHRLEYRCRIGAGDEVFRRAGEALMTWQMHNAAGFHLVATEPRADIGVNTLGTLGVGGLGLPVPCRVVWTVSEPDRTGFGYGTLTGHPVAGEESFVVTRGNAEVWFTVLAFSRPATWYTRIGGRAGRHGQQFFARRYATVLRRLAT